MGGRRDVAQGPGWFESALRGNLTPWWVLGTLYTMVFLFQLGAPRIFTDSPTMGFHIVMAIAFVLLCAWNLFHTPDQGERFRAVHVRVGWLAIVTGFASVLSGFAYILTGESTLPLDAQAFMMSIGTIQAVLQCLGLWYVRGRRWIQLHMAMMTYLFYTSGVLIAINWIPTMTTGRPLSGSGQTAWMFVSMLIGLAVANIAVKYNRSRMDFDSDKWARTALSGGSGTLKA
ncbi:hypothetical protein KFE25_003790 [Diacronema lutheri]|uniref:Uncharacterized protein n=1 Tax=Diacronema lutheri TaxID=2081491 RepID=A0A8J5X3L3_DIALT|nr:hypothetical protein KFE25_003790 [Diacronema lutheri]